MASVIVDGNILVFNGSIRKAVSARGAAVFAYVSERPDRLITDEEIGMVLRLKRSPGSLQTVATAMVELKKAFTEIGIGSWWVRKPGEGWTYAPTKSPSMGDGNVSGNDYKPAVFHPRTRTRRRRFDFPLPNFNSI